MEGNDILHIWMFHRAPWWFYDVENPEGGKGEDERKKEVFSESMISENEFMAASTDVLGWKAKSREWKS